MKWVEVDESDDVLAAAVVEVAVKAVVQLGVLEPLLVWVPRVRVFQYHPYVRAVAERRHELETQQHATVPNEIVVAPVIKLK